MLGTAELLSLLISGLSPEQLMKNTQIFMYTFGWFRLSIQYFILLLYMYYNSIKNLTKFKHGRSNHSFILHLKEKKINYTKSSG